MNRISRKSQVKQSSSFKKVSFQAHAFSDGDLIHLKLPGGIVPICSDASQPNGHPHLYAALARLFD
jgi:hypothetical protein